VIGDGDKWTERRDSLRPRLNFLATTHTAGARRIRATWARRRRARVVLAGVRDVCKNFCIRGCKKVQSVQVNICTVYWYTGISRTETDKNKTVLLRKFRVGSFCSIDIHRCTDVTALIGIEQGRRSLWDRGTGPPNGGTRPPIFWPGGTIMNVPHYLRTIKCDYHNLTLWLMIIINVYMVQANLVMCFFLSVRFRYSMETA